MIDLVNGHIKIKKISESKIYNQTQPQFYNYNKESSTLYYLEIDGEKVTIKSLSLIE